MGREATGRRGATGWQRWSEKEAREALNELAASEESAVGFAQRKGISTQRIAYWKKRLAGERATDFLAVTLPSTSGASIEIAAVGVVVRVREELDVEHVARLVGAIGRRVVGPC